MKLGRQTGLRPFGGPQLMPQHKRIPLAQWFWFAIGAAILYGLHQVFTKLAASHIGEGLGGSIIEASAALTILLYLFVLWTTNQTNQQFSASGIMYSVLTGLCVGLGTVLFFLMFQKGAPLLAAPIVLAGGSAIMALVAILYFKETLSLQRMIGLASAIVAIFLLRH